MPSAALNSMPLLYVCNVLNCQSLPNHTYNSSKLQFANRMIIRPTMKFVAFRELIKADKINVFYNSDTVRYYSRNGPQPFLFILLKTLSQ